MPTRSGKNFAVTTETPKSNVGLTPSPAIASGPLKRATKRMRPQDSDSIKARSHNINKRQKKSSATRTAPACLTSKPAKSRECPRPSHTASTSRENLCDAQAVDVRYDKTQKRTTQKDAGGRAGARRQDTAQNANTYSLSDPKSNLESQSAHVIDLTQDSDSDAMGCTMTRREIRVGEDDEAESDSRYALSRRQPGQARKTVRPAPQVNSELLMEEQEENFQPQIRVTKKAGAVSSKQNVNQDERHDSLHDIDVNHQKQTKKQKKATSKQKKALEKQEEKKLLKQRKADKKHEKKAHDLVKEKTQSRAVMFTVAEAITALEQAKNDPTSIPTIAYDLPTGACLTYPVQRSYHLGAMGRYGAAIVQSNPRDPRARNTLAAPTLLDGRVTKSSRPRQHTLNVAPPCRIMKA
ncbi:uncharacterized protein K460DRAFT_53213 [Cucurbitaria berberidis CBS 394.84]|uniref:Uncharacterized protein n=1 Tax=Cucurbitaria berberidis CBS 394.84 TaxID=1168544 RepID=A0A9P4GK36_9PLEO|nr:uncharacterized protein K460DRAFT_53213 [Cucurbitaria berberidis CBS 394.84]KAF1847082.1 hypothetical protein K460DRAFT_53213 [Cucurbitaria berberidis CBS 394.84]